MSWLLDNSAEHMRALAKDIADSGQLYESPLVSAIGNRFLVHDGNRRITCLKLLHSPQLAPDEKWRTFFAKIAANAKGTIPKEAECQIEEDPERILEILYRRHTGSQGGVGQSPWDGRAVSNFVARTGRRSRVSAAAEIETLLQSEGMLQADREIPLSNLDRLLSSPRLRQRVGIVVNEEGLQITHDKDVVLRALRRIVDDLVEQRVVLADLWRNTTKDLYLDRLNAEGILPKSEHAVAPQSDPAAEPTAEKKKRGRPPNPKPQADPSKRDTLIPQDLTMTLPTSATRIRAIWWELQFYLNFTNHSNAIAILFRVLLEMVVDHCIKIDGVPVHQNDDLHNRVRKLADHMFAQQRIDKKYRDILHKFGNSDVLLSAHTMNQFVHSQHFSPSPEHLRSMWDSLQLFIAECVRN